MSENTLFHIKQFNERLFLCSPSGNPFISFGINHLGALAEEDPFNLFQSKYAGDWNKVVPTVENNFRDWGFNTAGYHSPFELHRHLPFMAESYPYPAPVAYWMQKAEFPDVFDPLWAAHVKDIMTLMRDLVRQNIQNLIGYYWTDTPRWDLATARKLIGNDWVSSIRSLPASAPGKQCYIRFLKEHHADHPEIQASVCRINPEETDPQFNEGLTGIDPDHSIVLKDDREFLRWIARKYYQVLGEATRAVDPGRLIFGDRYLGDDHPKEVIEEAMPWIDVLSVQPLGIEFEEDLFDGLYELSQKPILICDHQSSFYTKEYPRTMWNQLPSESDAAKAYNVYLTAAFKKPYIIGYHRCQYIDRYDKTTKVLKQGLLREDETPYQHLVDQVKRTNHLIYESITPHQNRR